MKAKLYFCILCLTISSIVIAQSNHIFNNSISDLSANSHTQPNVLNEELGIAPLTISKEKVIYPILENIKSPVRFDTTRILPPPLPVGTLRDIAVGTKFKGSADDTVRFFAVMSSEPRHALLINDTTSVPPIKVATSGWQKHGANGRWIDSAGVGFFSAAVGDINNDGITDMVYGRYGGTSEISRLYRAWWDGTTWQRESLPNNSAPRTFRTGTFGITDIAIGDVDGNGINEVFFTAGKALFRMYWTGSTFVFDSFPWGDGSYLNGVAIGDFDPSYPGKEVAVVSHFGALFRLRYSSPYWYWTPLLQPTSNMVCFYDVAIGDVDPNYPGSEVVIYNGLNFQTYGNIFILRNTGSSWSLLQLGAYNQWGTFGEVAIGDVYDLHQGNEIIASAGSATGIGNQTIVLWNAGDNWYYRLMPSTGGPTYGVAVGNFNKYRPSTELQATDEMIIAGNNKILECEQRQLYDNDMVLDKINFAPAVVIPGETISVTIRLKNYGYNTQDTIRVFYRVAGSTTVQETCFANLGVGDSINYTFNTKYICPSPGIKAVKCSVAIKGEQYFADDTLRSSFKVYDTLFGIKLVGIGGDLPRLASACSLWNNSVITGNVVFKLTDTTYLNEIFPIVLTAPAGYRRGNWTLTIKPNGYFIPLVQGNSGTTIIDLKSINGVTLDSLTISNLSTTGSAVRLYNGASNNVIKNCWLKSNILSSTAGVLSFIVDDSLATGNNNNLIENCNITGTNITSANYGIYFSGVNTPLDNSNNVIRKCRIYDFSNTGIYFANNTYNTLISECDIYTQTQQTTSLLQGIYLHDYSVVKTKISRNKIRDFWTAGQYPTFRGIYLYYSSVSETTVIDNNFIYLDAMRTHQGATIYGIHEDSYDNVLWDIYYNSIYIGGNGLTSNTHSYGIYRNKPSIINFKNNIVFNNRSQTSGTGKHYAIYCANTSAGFNSDYNDLYVSTPGQNGQLIGYWSLPCTTLQQWRSRSSKDLHSISRNPGFIALSDLHINPNCANPDRKGVPISSINYDFDNQPRDLSHPDVGADEYTPNPPFPFNLISPADSAVNQPINGNLIWNSSIAADYYDVFLDTSYPPTQKVSALQSETVFSYVDIKPRSKYYWQIRAYNDTNPGPNEFSIKSRKSSLYKEDVDNSFSNSISSQIWRFFTVPIPIPPSNLTLSNVLANSIVLSWNDNSTDETGFYIRRDTSLSGSFPIIDSVESNISSYVCQNLLPNTHYYFRVSAYNQFGESKFSAKDTVTLAQVPNVPNLSDVSHLSLKVKIAPANNPNYTQYAIRIRDDAKTTKYLHLSGALVDTVVWATYSQWGGANGLKIVNLIPNVAYTVDCKSRNQLKIETGFSPSVTQTTLPSLEIPYAESFESDTFEPFGWEQQVIVSGGNNWSRVLNGTNPTQTPYDGIGQACYNVFNAPSGAHSRLITPPFDLRYVDGARLNFYMYHDNLSANPDSLVIELSTNYGGNWQRLNKFERYASTTGWQRHSVQLDSGIGNIVLIAFHAFAQGGNNIFIDSVGIELCADVMVSAISRPNLIEWKRIEFTPQIVVTNNSNQPQDIPVIGEIYRPVSGFYEGFEGTTFPPTNWVIYNNDGGTKRWQRITTPAHSGSAAIKCESEGSVLRNNDWLITPKIDIQGGNLRFWYRSAAIANDSLEIWLSTTNNDINSFGILLNAFSIRTTSWTEKIIPLSSYAGKSVYIAFVNKGLNQSTIYLDDISINYSAAVLLYTDKDTAYSISPSQSSTISFMPWRSMEQGNFLFRAYTTLPTDFNPGNNLLQRYFSVNPIPISLQSPNNGLITNDNTPYFNWTDVESAGSYRIQVAVDIEFQNCVIDTITNFSEWQVPDDNPLSDSLYYWRVRVESPGPSDPWSEIRTLTIDTRSPSAPILVLPPNMSVSNNQQPRFVWRKVSDAVLYNLVVDMETKEDNKLEDIETTEQRTRTNSLSAIENISPNKYIKELYSQTISNEKSIEVINVNISDTAYTHNLSLFNGSYRWKVRCKDIAGNWSDFTNEWQFTIDIIPPTIPSMISPLNGDTFFTPVQHFVWHSADEPGVVYNFVAGLLGSGTVNRIVTDTFTSTEFTTGVYNWKIRVRDSVGNWSDFSPACTFYVFTAAWIPREPMPTNVPGKYVKDGGALVGVNSSLYAIRGNKSNEFYKYESGVWSAKETIGFGPKPPPDNDKINKKKPGKGASLCFDGNHTIWATKGAGTKEIWAYDINTNQWTFKTWIPSLKGLKGGTSIWYKETLLYVLAGGQPAYAHNFFAYAPNNDTWYLKAKAKLGAYGKPWKDGSAIVGIRDTIYALKGSDKYNAFYLYDIKRDTWIEKESCPQRHPQLGKKNKAGDGGAMTTDGTMLYMIKGKGKQDFWRYTPGTPGTWTPLEIIPKLNNDNKSVPKTGAGLAYAEGKIYLLKGNNTAELWRFNPNKDATHLIEIKDSETTNIKNSINSDKTTTNIVSLQVNSQTQMNNITISYTVPIACRVTVKLFDASGRLVENLVDEHLNPGSYNTTISSNNLSQGIYFLRYIIANTQIEKKLVVY
ncbi:MAG: choice-of-anchor J domain-containing protein [candidate division WOR-3 bacterium]